MTVPPQVNNPPVDININIQGTYAGFSDQFGLDADPEVFVVQCLTDAAGTNLEVVADRRDTGHRPGNCRGLFPFGGTIHKPLQ